MTIKPTFLSFFIFVFLAFYSKSQENGLKKLTESNFIFFNTFDIPNNYDYLSILNKVNPDKIIDFSYEFNSSQYLNICQLKKFPRLFLTFHGASIKHRDFGYHKYHYIKSIISSKKKDQFVLFSSTYPINPISYSDIYFRKILKKIIIKEIGKKEYLASNLNLNKEDTIDLNYIKRMAKTLSNFNKNERIDFLIKILLNYEPSIEYLHFLQQSGSVQDTFPKFEEDLYSYTMRSWAVFFRISLNESIEKGYKTVILLDYIVNLNDVFQNMIAFVKDKNKVLNEKVSIEVGINNDFRESIPCYYDYEIEGYKPKILLKKDNCDSLITDIVIQKLPKTK